MREHLGRVFPAFVRPVEHLRALLSTDPYEPFDPEPEAKRVVTFLREEPRARLELPVGRGGARILGVRGREAFVTYVRSANTPEFMKLIEETFGKDVTTRTWDTVAKIAR